MKATIGVAGTNGKVTRICEGTPQVVWHKFWSQWRYNSRLPFGGSHGYLRDMDAAIRAFKLYAR